MIYSLNYTPSYLTQFVNDITNPLKTKFKPSISLCRGYLVHLMKIMLHPLYLGQHCFRTWYDNNDRFIAVGRHMRNTLNTDHLIFTFTVNCFKFCLSHSPPLFLDTPTGFQPMRVLSIKGAQNFKSFLNFTASDY